MSKERLEEIKDRYMDYEHDFNLKKEDVEFLFKQAERVQELEGLLDGSHIAMDVYRSELEKMSAENKRYREALEEISKMRIAYADMAGAKRAAQQALEAIKDEQGE